MKKLLLILICLFVSFEVRSESDDLKGLILECERVRTSSGPDVYIEFLSKNEINTVNFDILDLKIHSSQYGNYSVETFEIKLNFDGKNYQLNRNDGWLRNLKNPTNPYFNCKKLSKEITNLDSFLTKRMNKFIEIRKNNRSF